MRTVLAISEPHFTAILELLLVHKANVNIIVIIRDS
jgi:hypothetical protein